MHEVPLARVLGYWAERLPPEADAICHNDESITWRALDERTNQLARVYQRRGVKPNDFVAIVLPNGIEFLAATFAAWKAGATPLPISAQMPKLERDRIIDLANPALVVGMSQSQQGARPHLPPGLEPEGCSGEPLELVIAEAFRAMTSGGSTGAPKLIVSTSAAVWDIDSEFLWFRAGGAVLVPGPLYHTGPFTWAMLGMCKGNRIVLTNKFDAQATLRLIEKHRVTNVYLVPTMMHRIWSLPENVRKSYDLSSLVALWHLAAPCPPWLKEAFINWLGADVIWEMYGGTEGLGTTMISGSEWLNHRGSVGKPRPSCQIKILDDRGCELPPNTIGEVYILPNSGAGSTYRYVGAQPKRDEAGWESLGDVGYMDTEGYLYLTDRQTDMILSGGANIYPAEVEAAIEAFPGVRSCAVVGLPHEDLGNQVHAIVDAPTGGITQDALLEHLSQRLVRYKIPRSFEFVDQPLRDEAGKLQRHALRSARTARSNPI